MSPRPRTENRKRVVTLRTTYPDWTLQKIGDNVGLTKERVRQLLVQEGLPTKRVLISTNNRSQ